MTYRSDVIFKKAFAVFLILFCMISLCAAVFSVNAASAGEDCPFIVADTGYSEADDAISSALESNSVLELKADASFIIPMNKILTVRSNGYAFEATTYRYSEENSVVILDNGDGTHTVASYRDTGEKLRAMNVALSGMIQLRFYFTDLDYLRDNENAYIEVSVPGYDGIYRIVEKYYWDDLEADETGRYLITATVAAAQQSDKVRLQVVNGEERGKLRQYSVRDYGDIIINKCNNGTSAEKETYSSFLTPLKSMLNMGAMAQAVFDYKTYNPANAGLYLGETNPTEGIEKELLANNQTVPTASGERIKPVTYTVVLEGNTRLRVYFQYYGDKELEAAITRTYNGETRSDKVTVAKYSGEKITVGGLTATHFVEINNISANMYDVLYEIEVEEITEYNADKAVVTKSVINYLSDVLSSPSASEDTVRLACGMYLYYVSISDFLGVDIIPEDSCEHIRRHVEIIQAPSCGANGTGLEKCSDCGSSIQVSVNGIMQDKTIVIESEDDTHSFVFHESRLSDCATVGWNEYYSCENCSAVFDTDKSVIPSVPVLGIKDSHSSETDEWSDLAVDNELLSVKCCKNCQKVLDSRKYTVIEFSPEQAVTGGDQVKINVNITSNESFNSMYLTISGDSYPKGWKIAEYISGEGLTVKECKTLSDGRTYMFLKSSAQSYYEGTGTAATLIFDVGENAEQKNYSFSVAVTGLIGNNPVRAGFVSDVRVVGTQCSHNNLSYRNIKNKTHEVFCSQCEDVFGVSEHSYNEVYSDRNKDGVTVRNYTSICQCGKSEYCYTVKYSNGIPNVFVNAKELSGNIRSSGISKAELSEDGTYVTFTNAVDREDGYVYLYTGDSYTVNDPSDDGRVTGRYLLIKYRTDYRARTSMWVGANNGRVSPSNDDYFQFVNSDQRTDARGGYIADGNWHIAIIDLAAVKPDSFLPETEGDSSGNYVADYVRWDVLDIKSSETQSVDVAYVAMADSIYELLGIDSVRDYEYVYELDESYSISRTVNAVIDNPCFEPYQFYKKLGSSKAELKEDAKNRYMPYVRLYPTKTEGEETVALWSDTSYRTVSDSGNYVAFLYRKPVGSEADYIEIYVNSNLTSANGNGDGNPGIQLIADGVWHFAIIDLTDNNDKNKSAYYDPSLGISSLRFDYFNKPRELSSVTDVAFVAMFDSVEQAYEYYGLYVDLYLSGNCGHDNCSIQWELIDNGEANNDLAVEGRRCVACGKIVYFRNAVFKTCIDSSSGYNGSILSTLTWSSYEKVYDDRVILDPNGRIVIRGWAGINGNISSVVYRVMSRDGTVITDGWLDAKANITKVASTDAIASSVSTTLTDIVSYPVRYSLQLDLGAYISYGGEDVEGACVEFAFVASDAPDGSDDKYIPYLRFTDVVKYLPIDLSSSTVMFDYWYINNAINSLSLSSVMYDGENNDLPYVRLVYPEKGSGEKTVILWSNSSYPLAASSEYIGILYRLPENCVDDRIEFYVNSTSEKPEPETSRGFSTSESIGNGWQYRLIYIGDIDNGTDRYYPDIGVTSLRFDYFNSTVVGNTVDVAFIAMFESEEDAEEYYFEFAEKYLPQEKCDHLNCMFESTDDFFAFEKVCADCGGVIETVAGITGEGLKVFDPVELKNKGGNGYVSATDTDPELNSMPYAHFELSYDMVSAENFLWLNRNIGGSINNVDFYVAVMYRTNSEYVANELYISSDNLLTNEDNVIISTIVADEEWHLGIFDFSENGDWSAETGLGAMRLDIFNAKLKSGTYVDIAYIGFFSSEAAAESYFEQRIN